MRAQSAKSDVSSGNCGMKQLYKAALCQIKLQGTYFGEMYGRYVCFVSLLFDRGCLSKLLGTRFNLRQDGFGLNF